MRRAWTKDTRQRARVLFLEALARRPFVSEAAAHAGIGRATAYKWRDEDPEFATAWDDALETALDAAEAEMWRRGVQGWDEPLIGRVDKDQDGIITHVRRHSDAMLTLALKAHRPEKYRERFEHDHRGGIAVTFVNDWREADT